MSNGELSRRSIARLSVAAGLVLASGGLFAGNMGCGKADEGAASELEGLYREQGLSDEEVAGLAVLDVKPASRFETGCVTSQHGQGGALFCRDGQIMSWLFERRRGQRGRARAQAPARRQAPSGAGPAQPPLTPV